MRSAVVTVEPSPVAGDSSGNPPILDSNTLYTLAAIGGALTVVVITILLLGVVCVCRSRQRKAEVSNLKRSNTRRSSNASDFVYNSAYEWTCRQTRLLTHLRPDTTGYQSHWSLTRDISRKNSLQRSLQRNNSQREAGVLPTENGNSTKCVDGSHKDSDPSKGETEEACVVIENRFTRAESLEVNTDKTSVLQATAQPDEENTGSFHRNRNMYSNPLYARRKERARRREREGSKTEGEERRMEGIESGRIEEGEEEGGGETKDREREKSSEDIPHKPNSTASFITPTTEPLSSFLLSDSEAYDSGNASAVSTDIASSVQLSTTASSSRVLTHAHGEQQGPAEKGREG